MAPQWGMPAEHWLQWFDVWTVVPFTDGQKLELRPASRIPRQYIPLIRESKAAIVQHLVEKRQELYGLLEAGAEYLLKVEEQGETGPDYDKNLALFESLLSQYELFVMMAPEPAEVTA